MGSIVAVLKDQSYHFRMDTGEVCWCCPFYQSDRGFRVLTSGMLHWIYVFDVGSSWPAHVLCLVCLSFFFVLDLWIYKSALIVVEFGLLAL
jgi:hypothetical protein